MTVLHSFPEAAHLKMKDHERLDTGKELLLALAVHTLTIARARIAPPEKAPTSLDILGDPVNQVPNKGGTAPTSDAIRIMKMAATLSGRVPDSMLIVAPGREWKRNGFAVCGTTAGWRRAQR